MGYISNVNSYLIVAVFQPHRYSRIRGLMPEFPGAFDCADLVVITDIYAAGEKRIKDVNASALVKLLRKRGKDSFYLRNWKSNMTKMREELRKGDIVLSLGAGDINRFYELFSTAT
jgi:UDP-N-acetylmuramate--alanine ligase